MRFPPLALWATLTAGCTLLDPPTFDRPPLVDRGIAPWAPEPLTVCQAGACGEELAERVRGAHLSHADDGWRVVAELDGRLYAGVLSPGWRLDLEAAPLLVAEYAWQAGGLRDPAYLARPEGDLCFFGVADQSAIGVADVRANGAVARALPLWTAADLGVATLSAPSALAHGGRIGIAVAVDHAAVWLGWASTLEAVAWPAATFGLAEIDGSGWRDPSRLDDPELGVSADGLFGLFFAAEALGPPLDDAPPLGGSIGFAASRDGLAWRSFPGNPVHDVTVSFFFHGDESEPTVAQSDALALMLHRLELDGARLALAVHRF